MADDFKGVVVQQVLNEIFAPCVEIVYTEYFIPCIKKPGAEMRSKESGTAGNQDPFI
jgi:hypothetical protein